MVVSRRCAAPYLCEIDTVRAPSVDWWIGTRFNFIACYLMVLDRVHRDFVTVTQEQNDDDESDEEDTIFGGTEDIFRLKLLYHETYNVGCYSAVLVLCLGVRRRVFVDKGAKRTTRRRFFFSSSSCRRQSYHGRSHGLSELPFTPSAHLYSRE